MKLDGQLAGDKSPAARELAKAAIVALGHGDESALAYLHEVFESAPDAARTWPRRWRPSPPSKARRDADWQLLVRSLTVVEGSTARDVLRDLVQVSAEERQAAGSAAGDLDGPEARRSGRPRGRGAVGALDRRSAWPTRAGLGRRRWPPGKSGSPKSIPISPSRCCPSNPRPTSTRSPSCSTFWPATKSPTGSVDRGAAVFEKAQCVKCHRYGTRGEGIGPDLSNVSQPLPAQGNPRIGDLSLAGDLRSVRRQDRGHRPTARRTRASSGRRPTASWCCKPTPRKSTSPRPTSTRSCPARSRPCPRDCSTRSRWRRLPICSPTWASRQPRSRRASPLKRSRIEPLNAQLVSNRRMSIAAPETQQRAMVGCL